MCIRDRGIAKIGEVVTNVTETAVTAWEKLKTSIEPVNSAVEWMRDNWPTIGPIIEGIASGLSVLLIPALIKTGIEAGIAGVNLVAAWATSAAQAAVSVATQVAHIATLVAQWIWLGIEAGISAAKTVAAWIAQGLDCLLYTSVLRHRQAGLLYQKRLWV